MKHIKPIEAINESRAPRQLYQLYYISDTPLDSRHRLPSRWNRKAGELIPTYTMIQDAIAHMTSTTQHLYQCTVKAALGTEDQFFEWLLKRGYDPEEYFSSLVQDGVLPNGIDPEELSDLRWDFDGIEAGELVYVWDLSTITDSMFEYQPSEIARLRGKLKLQPLEEDLIPGGKADNLTPQDLAQQHNVSVNSIMKELAIGVKVELEHVDNEDEAREIAMDHIQEDPRYYQRLISTGIADEPEAIALYKRFYGK
jgi:hypothetical protein